MAEQARMDENDWEVRTPDEYTRKMATVHGRCMYRKALDEGAPTEVEAQRLIRRRGLRDADRVGRIQSLYAGLALDAESLKDESRTIAERQVIATRMRHHRSEVRAYRELVAALESETAEARGVQGQFDFLCAACIVDSRTGKPRYRTTPEYIAARDSGDSVAHAGYWLMAERLHRIKERWDEDLPETIFLRDYPPAHA